MTRAGGDSKDSRQQFDRWAKTYDRSPAQLLFFRWVHQRLLNEVANWADLPASILDIGCGTGKLLERLSVRFPGATLTGVDASDGMIKRAAVRLPNAVVRHATAENLPFEDESFDLVTSTISFHHWSDQAKGLREVSRVLRASGRFILADLADLPWWLAWHRNDGHFLSCGDRHRALADAGQEVTRSYRHFLGIVRVTVSSRATSIRPASIADLERVAQITESAILRMESLSIHQWDANYPNSSHLREDIEAGQMHVIQTGRTIAGFVTLNEWQHEAYAAVRWNLPGRALVVHRLTVDPAFQGRRLASRLMDFVEREADAQGYDVIRLDAFSKNPRAMALYEHRSYSRVGEMPTPKGPFYCYEKSVDRA